MLCALHTLIAGFSSSAGLSGRAHPDWPRGTLHLPFLTVRRPGRAERLSVFSTVLAPRAAGPPHRYSSAPGWGAWDWGEGKVSTEPPQNGLGRSAPGPGRAQSIVIWIIHPSASSLSYLPSGHFPGGQVQVEVISCWYLLTHLAGVGGGGGEANGLNQGDQDWIWMLM